jgi:hypothetical protein
LFLRGEVEVEKVDLSWPRLQSGIWTSKMGTGGTRGTRGMRDTSSCKFWCLLEGLVIVFFMWVTWESDREDIMLSRVRFFDPA